MTYEDKFKHQNKSPEQVRQVQVSQEVRKFFGEEQRLEDEEKRKNVAQAAEDACVAVRRKALNSVDIIGMIKAEDGEVIDWMYSTLTPQNSQVEVNPYGWDGTHKGSGSKSKRKKDKKGNKIFMDPWTAI